MNLYFISYTDTDGICYDAFAQAETPREAFGMWLKWDVTDEDWAGYLRFKSAPAAGDVTVFEVTPSHIPGILGWHTGSLGGSVEIAGHANFQKEQDA